MAKYLLIVESPAKAKTITKYLGEDYIVASSYGHICDLPKNNKAIDIANNFEVFYEVSKEKEKVVAELKKLKKSVQEVYLATDEDREGEAISWHLCNVLGLSEKTTKRVTYTEITEKAIKKAVANPRHIDMDLVNAQQARRVLDRLVGFGISPILWRKVKPNLSAGRVQSVAVRILVDREREILNFQSQTYFKLQALFDSKDINGKEATIKAEYNKDFTGFEEANSQVESFVGATYKIANIEKRPGKKSPAAPFTTSTLQQEASKKLYFSVSKTMVVAQRLYEAGHITYMRTDSVNLSETALQESKSAILNFYGEDFYSQPRMYQSKTANAQEAHEAIRPTDFTKTSITGDSDEQKLYDLIWKRAIASQMTDAKTENTTVSIDNDKNKITLTARQEVVLFEGFLKAYVIENDDEDEDGSGGALLPPMNIGEILPLNVLTATEKFSKHPPRYNEASLVKKLEELGIGRPSTYAPTISTIQNRDYVIKDTRDGKKIAYRVVSLKKDKISTLEAQMVVGAEKNKLFPTDIGILVTDFLTQYFDKVVDFKFTAKIEEEFDKISHGKLEWTKMLKTFYDPFQQEVEKTIETAERVSGERILGNHPDTGEVILVRMGRFGPMAQIGLTEEGEDAKKPRYAKLKREQNIETLTMEEALELFKLPRILGQFEDKDLKVNIGRFGPYIQHNSGFISLKKEDDPFTIDLDLAIQRILEKRTADANKIIKDFSEHGFQILNGRWGPYIKMGSDNYKIPKTENAETLSLDKCLELIESQKGAPKKKGKFTRRK